VSEIRGLLSEARATLAGFRDSRGVGLIEATGSRLNARLALLNYQGTRAWRLAK
jgi:hypothetical protein